MGEAPEGPAAPRRQCRYYLPEHVVRWPERDGGLAPRGSAQHRSVALVLRRQGCAGRSATDAAPLPVALLRPLWHDRGRRRRELELRLLRQQRYDRPPPPLQL